MGVLKNKMQNFNEELKDLKNIHSFIEQETKKTTRPITSKSLVYPSLNSDKKNHLRTNLGKTGSIVPRITSQASSPGREEKGNKLKELTFVSDIKQSQINELKYSQISQNSGLRNSEMKRRDYLPTNLNNRLRIKGESITHSQIPTTAFLKQGNEGNEVGSSPDIYQTFFTSFENIKNRNKQNSQSKNTKETKRNKLAEMFNEKDVMLIPRDINHPQKKDLKVEQEILKHLEEQLALESVHSSLEATLNTSFQPKKQAHEQPKFPIKEHVSLAVNSSKIKDDILMERYMDLDNFQVYKNPKNLLYLKASSLFNDTILFENDQLSLFCRTEKSSLNSEGRIALILTMRPKMENTELITFIENEAGLKIEPMNLTVKHFDKNYEQKVSFLVNEKHKMSGFPVMNITVGPRETTENFRIVLPFTANKFLHNEIISLDEVMKYLENVF